MNDLKKIIVIVKEVRYQRIEISEQYGFEMPKSAEDIAQMAIDLREDVSSFIDDDANTWDSDLSVESIDWVEEKDQ